MEIESISREIGERLKTIESKYGYLSYLIEKRLVNEKLLQLEVMRIVSLRSDVDEYLPERPYPDDFIPDEDYDHVGIAMTCPPVETMKGKLFYCGFSTFASALGDCDISNITDIAANITVDVYDGNGILKVTETFTIPAKGIVRTFSYIGSILNIANPALLKITSDQYIVVSAGTKEESMKAWGFVVLPKNE